MPEPIEMGPELDIELTSDSDPVPPTPAPETPSPETPPTPPEKKDDPVDPAKPVDPVAPKPEETLYDLPDGRKVDATTLAKEFKENFLPEFTRKSQDLAAYERGEKPGKPQDGKNLNNPPDPNAPKWKDPNYVPENYAEVIEIATEEAEKRIQAREQAEQERVKGVQSAIEATLTEIKKTDPNLDENSLFQHANKYGFTDLMKAHANMKDIKQAAVDAEQNAIKNLRTRDTDPIAGGDSGATSPDDGVDMSSISGFSNAVEFLGRVKGTK